MAIQKTDTQPWYKERWPWILMAGPAIVIVAGVITAWLAIISSDGLVEDDYYKQGLAVNQQMQRDRAAGEMGVQADLMLSGRQLRLLVAGMQGEIPEKLKLKVTHPTRAGMDQLVSLQSESGGMYRGTLSSEISGRWHVVLEDPQGKWRLQGDWQVDVGEPLRMSAAGK